MTIRSTLYYLILVVCSSSSANAEPGETALILSFSVAPTVQSATSPADGDGGGLAPYLKPVADALPQLAPAWDSDLRRRIDATFGERPRGLEQEKLEAIKVRAERIEQSILLGEGNMNAGIQQLESYRRALVDAQGALALDPQARDLYFRMLLTLSTAYQIKEHPSPKQSAERMTELVNAFSELPTSATLSPSMLDLYQRTKAVAETQRRVALRIDRGSYPTAKVFVNGRAASCSSAACNMRLLPNASYMVFASTPSGSSRVHRINLGDLDSTFSPDIPFEVALASERFVGFRFDDAPSQERNESRFVSKLANTMNFKTVLILSKLIEGERTGIKVKTWERDVGIASGSVGMLGGVLTPLQVAELSRRVVEHLNGKQRGAGASAPASAPTGTSQASSQPQTVASASQPLADGTNRLPNNGQTVSARSVAEATHPSVTSVANRPSLPPLTSQPTSSADQLAEDAKTEYVHMHYKESIEIGARALNKAVDATQRNNIWRVIGSSKCFLKDAQGARAAFSHVTTQDQAFLRYICGRNGIDL